MRAAGRRESPRGSAVAGREPITLFRPVVRPEAAVAVEEVLRSGWLGPGPRVEAFEEAFGAMVGARHCVAVSSCTAALQLALRCLDLAPGSEVVTTPLTFVSANQVILEERLVPVYADVQPDTGNVDPASVAERVSDRTGAILVLHYGGLPCDLDELRAIAATAGVPLVEDCAHACGASYRGRPIGADGAFQAFSFQAVKNLPMGDGGALTVATEEHARRLRRLRWSGISASTYERNAEGRYRWDYEVAERGLKAALNDVQAAIGLAQLPWLASDNARRGELAERYRTGLAGVRGIELLREPGDRVSSRHLFCVLAEDRDRLVERLGDAGIGCGVHYRPSYDHAPLAAEPLPGVERFWRRVVSLPLHLGLDDEDVDRVVGVIAEGW